MFEIKFEERYLPKLLFILKVNNAIYKVNRKYKKIRVYLCSKQCKKEIEGFLLKHQSCDICHRHRVKYIVEKDGKFLKVCGFCKKENNFEGERLSLSDVEFHHDIATGLLRACNIT